MWRSLIFKCWSVSFWSAVGLLVVCSNFAQAGDWFTGRQFDVFNIQTRQIHPARRDDGVLRVNTGGPQFENWRLVRYGTVENPRQSPYREFSEFAHSQYPKDSFFKTSTGYFQTQRTIRTGDGQIFIEAAKLFDQDDGRRLNRSVRGLFLHTEWIALSEVVARQEIGRCQEPQSFERAHAGSNLEIHSMERVACLTNGDLVLHAQQERRIDAPGVSNRYQAQVYEVVNWQGQAQTEVPMAASWSKSPAGEIVMEAYDRSHGQGLQVAF